MFKETRWRKTNFEFSHNVKFKSFSFRLLEIEIARERKAFFFLFFCAFNVPCHIFISFPHSHFLSRFLSYSSNEEKQLKKPLGSNGLLFFWRKCNMNWIFHYFAVPKRKQKWKFHWKMDSLEWNARIETFLSCFQQFRWFRELSVFNLLLEGFWEVAEIERSS